MIDLHNHHPPSLLFTFCLTTPSSPTLDAEDALDDILLYLSRAVKKTMLIEHSQTHLHIIVFDNMDNVSKDMLYEMLQFLAHGHWCIEEGEDNCLGTLPRS